MKNRSLGASQRAHLRLARKHEKKMRSDSKNYDKHFIRGSYHAYCVNRQENLGRVLTEREKKKAYDTVISTFY